MFAAIQKNPSGRDGSIMLAVASSLGASLERGRARSAGGDVRAEPVLGASQLPGRFEIAMIGRKPPAPDVRGLVRLGQIGALAIERVGIVLSSAGPLCGADLHGPRHRGRCHKSSDVEYEGAGSDQAPPDRAR